MIWALVLYGIACLLGLAAAALSARPPMPARHRAPVLEERWVPACEERWTPDLGDGWLLRMNGYADYVPRARRRADVEWHRVARP